ncbi:MAG: TetR/AcrR family transcriptional regulator [Acidobacteriota bacterium]
MPTDGTKTRLLDAAEHLFAERGFPATSLRALTAEAGANLASVHYHFGSKEALLSAVLARRLGPVNRERLERLDAIELQAEPAPPPVDQVLRAFLLPPFQRARRWGSHGANFMKLAGRMYSEANPRIQSRFLEQFEEGLKRFSSALARSLPHLDAVDLHWRMHFVIGTMAHILIWNENAPCLARQEHRAWDADAIFDSLVRFVLAGLQASTNARWEGGD